MISYDATPLAAEAKDVASEMKFGGDKLEKNGASKAALNRMAELFAKELAPRGIKVNAISPGWVRTAMGGSGAPRSIDQGAESVLWGARLGANGPNGGFFEDGHPLRTWRFDHPLAHDVGVFVEPPGVGFRTGHPGGNPRVERRGAGGCVRRRNARSMVRVAKLPGVSCARPSGGDRG
jgi:hypothetical protein